ncbi:MAG: NAD(P)-dependent oxidoreductase [Sulfobacillus acidophilus]|uniref:dTDP-4-dehydrorhamnose reductase n=1 Tax=Sulfobacillus acidophilus TaxID=53633 RepID=A0A2T2WLA8_9FIRM|nr:MAG: NAD(P)-dependent oxidoreductase [Sulfobacillus acidophilus]
MKHLVIGASGQVGHALMLELSRRGESAVGTYLSHPVPQLIPLDMRDQDQIAALLKTVAPDAVWIPAAMPDVDYCERHPETSYATNVEGPRQVLEQVASRKIPLVYFSSDYVFDGSAGPYRETDTPHALQVYGQHKILAETELLQYRETLVVRPAWVYSDERNPRNFVFRVISDLRAGRVIRAAIDQYNTPTPAAPLAWHALDALSVGFRGILHVAGPERLSRLELVQRIAARAGYAQGMIEAVRLSELSLAALRPSQGGLITNFAQFAVADRLEDMDFRRLLTGS